MTEFFWPIVYWTKEQILKNHQIPLWNNLHLAGTPLVSDPQAPIFYPLNIFTLIMPLDFFFAFSFLVHIALAGVGMYFCSKLAFKFSPKISLLLAFLYALSPKIFAYLEAGHVGLVYSFAWIPFIVLGTVSLRPILLGISLSLLYYSHLPTFLIVVFPITAFLLWKRKFKTLAVTGSLTFLLTSISLLPQISWQGQSTRYLLLQDRDVYPKWTSVMEASKAIIIPNIGTEKAIALGILPASLAVLGFLKLKKNQRLLITVASLAIGLMVLNNVSPIYSLLLKQNWYVLLRVSTRFWVLIIILTVYLTGVAISKYKSKLIYVLAILAIAESVFRGTAYFKKPVNVNSTPKEIYEFLAEDKSLFRVYCISRCISQKDAAIYNLELLDGYSTLQQLNFYKHAWQLTGAYWNYYTLSIPPYGIDTKNPDIKSLGEYNVKYIISPTPLKDQNFSLKKRIDNFLIYENKLSVPRNYDIYTPNFIRIKIDKPTPQLVIPEVFSPGWVAYLDGREKVPVQETPNALRAVDIKSDTKFVDLKYEPYQIPKN